MPLGWFSSKPSCPLNADEMMSQTTGTMIEATSTMATIRLVRSKARGVPALAVPLGPWSAAGRGSLIGSLAGGLPERVSQAAFEVLKVGVGLFEVFDAPLEHRHSVGG